MCHPLEVYKVRNQEVREDDVRMRKTERDMVRVTLVRTHLVTLAFVMQCRCLMRPVDRSMIQSTPVEMK